MSQQQRKPPDPTNDNAASITIKMPPADFANIFGRGEEDLTVQVVATPQGGDVDPVAFAKPIGIDSKTLSFYRKGRADFHTVAFANAQDKQKALLKKTHTYQIFASDPTDKHMSFLSINLPPNCPAQQV